MFENETNTIQGYIDYLNEILAAEGGDGKNFDEEELRDRLLECKEASKKNQELDNQTIERMAISIMISAKCRGNFDDSEKLAKEKYPEYGLQPVVEFP